MTTPAHGQPMKAHGPRAPATLRTYIPTRRQEEAMPRTLPALLGPFAALLALVALLAFSLRALAALVVARATGRPIPPVASPALLAVVALVALPHDADHGDRAHGERADTRRGRFIPPASRVAIDDMASDIRKLRVRRYGMATYPAYGRVDAALHALLRLVPYPTDAEERELMEDALRCLEERAPRIARALAEPMRAHYLSEATGGASRAP